MSSSPQDAGTQSASSAAAQAAASTQAANAATAQTNANNQQSTLFGTYNPATNTYTGGTESANLSPSSMTTNGLTGSFASLYGTQAQQQAQAAQQGVSTSLEEAASRGLGKTPAGYTADQARQAYQQQAENNSTNYSTDFGNQNAQQVSLYNNANQMLANSANQNQNSATANNSGAAGTNTSLYGTASQQVASPLGAVLGATGTLGAAAIGKIPCWIAAELFGGWMEPRTRLVRAWMCSEGPKSRIGRLVLRVYRKFGERVAAKVRTSAALRAFFLPVFEEALGRAMAWQGAA